MSIDFTALMSASRRPATSCDWPEQIERHLRYVALAFIEKWRVAWCVERWEIPASAGHLDSRFARVAGPGGFSLMISPVAVDLYHCSKWRKFLYDEEHRGELRAICFEFAEFFGSDRAIYLPELIGSGFHDGLDLDRMEAELKRTIGPPSSSIDEIKRLSEDAGHQDLHDSCYYIDHFEDLRQRQEVQ
jgi:hypothetical protein